MRMQHVTIMTEKLDESVEFYQKAVGLTIRADMRGTAHPIVFMSNAEGETCVELVHNPEAAYYGGGISMGFCVDDIRKEYEEKKAMGLNPGEMIKPNPHATFFFVQDPNGVGVQFIEEK